MRIHVLDRLVRHFCTRAHHDDHSLGVGRANVVEQVIGPACYFRKLIHHCLDFFWGHRVIRICRLPDLEEYVGILRGATQYRVIRRQGALPVLDHALHVDQSANLIISQNVDFVDFVRSAKTIEEMQEGNSALQRGRMGDQRKVHGFLHRVRTEHGKTGGAAKHHVAVIAKDGKGVRRHGSRRNMKCGGRKFARYLVHVRNHQQQTLRRRERCS